MMNLIITFISIILCFSVLVLIEKLFKKEGVYCYMIFATITANILVCKNIEIFNTTFTLGNILFASNFLATDILCEKYGMEESKKGVYMSLVFAIMFIVSTQIGLMFIPSQIDVAHTSMETLFAINLRTTISSVLMFFLSNIADVYLYDHIKRKLPNKLWVRNNVSTLTTNCLENFLFVMFAFVGIYDFNLILEIALTTCFAEVIIGLCDTPFLYLSRRV